MARPARRSAPSPGSQAGRSTGCGGSTPVARSMTGSMGM